MVVMLDGADVLLFATLGLAFFLWFFSYRRGRRTVAEEYLFFGMQFREHRLEAKLDEHGFDLPEIRDLVECEVFERDIERDVARDRRQLLRKICILLVGDELLADSFLLDLVDMLIDAVERAVFL